MSLECFNCNNKSEELIFDFPVCCNCLKGMKLQTPKTIKKNFLAFEADKKGSFQNDIDSKLEKVEKTYIKAKIKLLDIQEKLNNMK